jgi:p-cumate 2,3-dioxygenase beta subunit
MTRAQPDTSPDAASPQAAHSARAEVEDLLYLEAALLDEWRLAEWVALFTEDARYVVPTTDKRDGDPRVDLVYVDDDIVRLRARATRLASRHAYRESPHSQTRRLITNVRVAARPDGDLDATAAFAIYRFRRGSMDTFVGRYVYQLARIDGHLRIRYRRTELDLDSLEQRGAISIVL